MGEIRVWDLVPGRSKSIFWRRDHRMIAALANHSLSFLS